MVALSCSDAYESAYWGEQRGSVVLTGDTLFQGNAGRASPATIDTMFASLQRLKVLPEQTLLLPAHHYGYCTSTLVGRELKANAMLKARTIEQFRMINGMPAAMPSRGGLSRKPASGRVARQQQGKSAARELCRPVLRRRRWNGGDFELGPAPLQQWLCCGGCLADDTRGHGRAGL